MEICILIPSCNIGWLFLYLIFRPIAYFHVYFSFCRSAKTNGLRQRDNSTSSNCNRNNYIINDGRRVYQGCTRYLENTAIIDGYRFGLVRIEWHKSVLTWKGIKVGLELHIVHSDVESNQVITFVFPLSLVDLRKEFFTDLSYHNQPTDVATLNSLLTRIDQIPAYYCCTPNQGAMVNFNLCPIANLILIQKYFYEYKMSQNITWFIAQPQMFDRTIGLNIRSKLVG